MLTNLIAMLDYLLFIIVLGKGNINMYHRISDCSYNMTLMWCLILAALSPLSVHAEVLITKQKALELAFPDVDRIENKTFIITDGIAGAIESKYKIKLPSKIYTINIAIKEGNVVGYSVIDTHMLRTKSQTIIVFIKPDGHLNYVEILAFYEPPEYKASVRWLDLFRNKTINDNLRSGYDIPNISGATISSSGTAEAVKRALAIFEYFIKGENIN